MYSLFYFPNDPWRRWDASLVVCHIHAEAIAPVENRESKDGEGDPNSSCIMINFDKYNNKKDKLGKHPLYLIGTLAQAASRLTLKVHKRLNWGTVLSKWDPYLSCVRKNTEKSF